MTPTVAPGGAAQSRGWTDTLTIARHRTLRLAKLVKADGTIVGYDKAKTVDLIEVPITGMGGLLRLLHRLENRPDCAVLRGRPIAGDRVEGVQRRLYPCEKTGAAPTLREVPHRWVALDLDGLERPDTVLPADLAACASIALQHLPGAFRGVRCIAQATASHGLKSGIRLRLWYWLSRPTSGGELKRWLCDTPVDRSIFGGAQCIYVASPVFETPRTDHLPLRLTELPGADCALVPSPDDLAPPPRPLPPPRQPITDAMGTRYARAALTSAADRILRAGEGNRHPTIVAEGRGLARLVEAGMLSQADVVAVLCAAAHAAGKEDPHEIASAIAWAFDNPSAAGLPEVRHAS